jgi:hypothetical protein
MSRLPSLAVTLIGFGFTAMGLFLLFNAETDDDLLMAGVTTLFFAAVGLVGLMDLLPAALPRPQADGRFIVRASRLRSGIFALGGLAFLVTGLVMALQMLQSGVSINLLLGALGAPFGLLVLVFALRQLVAAGPLYILDQTGIESRSGMKWRLAWTDISDISTGRVGPNAWLMFDTMPHVPDPPGRAARLNRRFNMPPYAVAPGTSGVDFNALADVIFDLWETHRAPEASA